MAANRSQTIRLNLRDLVAIVTLARPDRLNALTPELFKAMESAIRASLDDGVRASRAGGSADHRETRIIGAYMEHVRDPEAFHATALRAASRGEDLDMRRGFSRNVVWWRCRRWAT